MTGEETYVALLNMARRAGESAYDRLRLAHQLLRDQDWVQGLAAGNGDEGMALDLLEAKAFPDLCGAVTLAELLAVYEDVPDKEDWKARRYNVREVSRLAAERRRAARAEAPRRAAASGTGGRATTGKPRDNYRPARVQEFSQLPATQANMSYEELLADWKRLREENRGLRAEVARLQRLVKPEA